MSEPNWTTLREIAMELEASKLNGIWNMTVYNQLLAKAKVAVNGHNEFLEFLANEQPEGAK